MPIRAAFLGCGVAIGGAAGPVAGDRLEPQEIFRRSLTPYTALVFGDRALLELDPDRVRVVVTGLAARILLVPVNVAHSVVVRWIRGGVGEVVDPQDLEDCLRRLTYTTPRPRIDTGSLFGATTPPAGGAVRVALAALHDVDRCVPVNWSLKLGWDRHRLNRICRRGLKASAGAVAWEYVRAVVERLRSEGRTIDECAEAVGYSEGSALQRAFTRRKLQVPPKPAEDRHPSDDL